MTKINLNTTNIDWNAGVVTEGGNALYIGLAYDGLGNYNLCTHDGFRGDYRLSIVKELPISIPRRAITIEQQLEAPTSVGLTIRWNRGRSSVQLWLQDGEIKSVVIA
jgi:hypothetical protein